MPDRVTSGPARRFAGAALLTSVLVHGGLLALVLWLISDHGEKEDAASVPVELVVVVEDDPRDGTRGGKEVALSSIERYPAPVRMHSTVVDPPLPSEAETRPSRPFAPVAGTTGPKQDGGPTFFQVSAVGKSVVYVLDHSMSMGEHDGLRQARGELLASLGRLPQTALFQVIPYNQIAEPLSVHNYAGMLRADADTLAEVAQAIAALRATGRTNHLQALLRGLTFRPDVLYLATDADGLSNDEIAAVSRCNGGRCSIHVIDFSARPDESASPLRQLALQNRGTYRHVPVKEL